MVLSIGGLDEERFQNENMQEASMQETARGAGLGDFTHSFRIRRIKVMIRSPRSVL